MSHEEEELRRRFGELRDAESRQAPEFRALLDRPARAPTARHPGTRIGRLTLAAAVVALVAIGVTRSRRPHPMVEIDLASTSWHGPTDFLLVLPDNESLRSVPRLGELDLNWRTP